MPVQICYRHWCPEHGTKLDRLLFRWCPIANENYIACKDKLLTAEECNKAEEEREKEAMKQFEGDSNV